MAVLRRLALAVSFATAAVFLPGGVAAAQDRDCADFPSQEAAQAALQPGDPERLDGDDDGIACETLDDEASQSGESTSPDESAQPDRDCPDFPTQGAAQAALRPGDPERLDADNDGVACENGSTAGAAESGDDSTDGTTGTSGGDDGQIPSGGVEAGHGGTAGNDSAVIPLSLFGGAAVLAAGAVAMRRPRSE